MLPKFKQIVQDVRGVIMADLYTYIIFFLVWLLPTLLLRAVLQDSRTGARRPPSPRALPILGHLHLLAPIPHQALHKLSTRYGPLMHIRLGSVPCVVASSAATAKEFLKTHELHYASRPDSVAVRCLSYGSADFSFAPYGPYWKFMKKLCMSELLGGRTLDQLQPVRRGEENRFLATIAEKAKTGEAVDMGGELLKLTNNVISRMTMSRRCTETAGAAEDVRKMVEEMAELTGKFNLADYVWFCKNWDLQGVEKRLKDVHLRFDRMMEAIIKEKEEAKKVKKTGDDVQDLLDILLRISQDEAAEIKITRENIKAFILDIFVAGTDTSAVTTEWALAELINHPSILAKARQEIDSIVGKGRLVEESDIANLPYLRAIIKETLRLHPTGPLIPRESTRDCTIDGYNIPANTRLFVNVWAIGRDPEYWQDPLQFRPERFMPGSEAGEEGQCQIDVRGQHFQLLPFGSGRRGCPGASLGLQVVQTTVAALIQCFEWTVGELDGKVDMTEAAGLTLPRAKPLLCVPIARFDPLPSIEH